MDAFVNDIRLFYEQYGEGRPLVLLHGNGEDHTIFDEAMEVLGERFTCFAIDSRGHGDSDMVDELHYEDMAADLLAFLEALDLWDVVLCGYSDGGIVALMAAPWTDRVYNTILLTEPHIPAEDLRAIHARTLVVAGSRDIIRERNTRFIAETIPGAELLILPGEDHGSYINHSDKIAYIIQDFCQ